MQSNCPRQKEKRKNNMSALNGTVYLMYSEHAKPDTNALIIISPHKGLLSQLAAWQRRISGLPFFLVFFFNEPADLLFFCLGSFSNAADVYAANDNRGLLHCAPSEGDDRHNWEENKKVGE